MFSKKYDCTHIDIFELEYIAKSHVVGCTTDHLTFFGVPKSVFFITKAAIVSPNIYFAQCLKSIL